MCFFKTSPDDQWKPDFTDPQCLQLVLLEQDKAVFYVYTFYQHDHLIQFEFVEVEALRTCLSTTTLTMRKVTTLVIICVDSGK